MDPRARGCFVGLSLTQRRGHLVRAIMESVAFSLRDSISIFRELGVRVENRGLRRRRGPEPAVEADSG